MTLGVIYEPVLIREKPFLDDPEFKLKERLVRSDKGPKRRLVWDRRGRTYVVIAPFTARKELILVEEPKYGILRRVINLPAGGIDSGEEPVEAAIRELQEETGFRPRRMTLLRSGIIDFADKIAGGEHFLFLAQDAEHVQDPEDSSRAIIIPSQEAVLLLKGSHPNAEIATAMTLSCLALAIAALELW